MSTPASSRSARTSGGSDAGPRVATILVRRIGTASLVGAGRRRSLDPPPQRVGVGHLDQSDPHPVGVGDPTFPQPPGLGLRWRWISTPCCGQALVLGVDVGTWSHRAPPPGATGPPPLTSSRNPPPRKKTTPVTRAGGAVLAVDRAARARRGTRRRRPRSPTGASATGWRGRPRCATVPTLPTNRALRRRAPTCDRHGAAPDPPCPPAAGRERRRSRGPGPVGPRPAPGRGAGPWLATPERIEAVYTSPLRRSVETAPPAGRGAGAAVTPDAALAEYDAEAMAYIPIEELQAAGDPRWMEVPTDIAGVPGPGRRGRRPPGRRAPSQRDSPRVPRRGHQRGRVRGPGDRAPDDLPSGYTSISRVLVASTGQRSLAS